MTESEGAADAQAVNVTEVQRQTANELIAGDPAEARVEMNQQRGVHAQRFDDPEFLRQRLDQGRIAPGRDHRVRMTIERDRDGDGFMLPRVLDRLADHLLMAQVHAVEHPDGYADLALAGIQFTGLGDDVHRRQT